MDDAQGIDLSTDIPANASPPAVANSPDSGLEYNTIPLDVYVIPPLVDANDATNNIMPGADAAASSAGTMNGVDKTGQPGATSFFSDAFKAINGAITISGKITGKSGTDVTRLQSSPTGNVGAQNNTPPVNESLSIANKALETATSTIDQVGAWTGLLGNFTSVKKSTVVTPKTATTNSNYALMAGLAVAAIIVGFFFLRG